ncbi:hypothetical protein NP493_850g01031 [Ridgeia piscesae]|uniref:UspA domain-containing protein n=1 Tax=Ridgeia piscesae TaxID=27915 RepID=A0AAD9KM18_RIDPI|nr:hypothetical protein NP493_850g01031 [Ridgeia piscesae]
MKELYVPSTLVMLVHCVDLPFMPTRDTFEDQTAEGKEKGFALEKQYVSELLKLGIRSKFFLSYERPQSFITDLAKKEKVDLVVLGCGGKHTLANIILGSVSQYVLNHAHCAVAICRNGTYHHEPRTPSPKCFKSS